MESSFSDPSTLSYNCALCKFSAKGKHGLLAHVRTMQHLQMEQIHQLQKRAEGNVGHTEIGDIFQVVSDNDDEVKAKKEDVDASAELKFQCPLCQEKFGSQEALEAHAFSVHSVNAEGLQRLQSLISGSHW